MRPIPFAATVLGAAALTLPAQAQPAVAPAATAPTASTPMFSAELPDVPGKQMVVVKLAFPPSPSKAPPHKHPGSVWVYITQGEARLGVEGQPPKLVKAGESWFEPMGAIHDVSESASSTEPAYGFAMMLVPDDAPLATVVDAHAGHAGH
ncbi:MAG TPA: cupin domain-containing protein [Caulobacteraceae bacterium]|jgi:quercetin dioxygenase-like cupin family protein